MMLTMVLRASVVVAESTFVHSVVEFSVGRGEQEAQAFVGGGLGARTDGVEVGERAFDLIEDRYRVGG